MIFRKTTGVLFVVLVGVICFAVFKTAERRAPRTVQGNTDMMEIYNAFLDQYRIRPDTRFIKAFDILCDVYWEAVAGTRGENPFHIGELVYVDGKVRVPLMRETQRVSHVELSLPPTFADALSAMVESLHALSAVESGPSMIDWKSDSETDEVVQQSLEDFRTVDILRIVAGLTRLQEQWQKQKHPTIIAAAVRGYGMRLFNVYGGHSLQHGDETSARAMALLALARWMDPDLSMIQEEVLLAVQMQYKNHAFNLLESRTGEDSIFFDQVLGAYLKEDIVQLRQLKVEYPDEFIASYLLARLYRDSGLRGLAAGVAKDMLARFPRHNLSVIEAIRSLDMADVRILSQIYPWFIIELVQEEMPPEYELTDATWLELMKIASFEFKEMAVSLAQFNRLLDTWVPLGVDGDEQEAAIIDGATIRNMYRELYEEAVDFRFRFLLDQWNVVGRAKSFLDRIAQESEPNPLIYEMRLHLLEETAGYKERDKLCLSILNDPDIVGEVAATAYFRLDDILSVIQYGPVAVRKFDSRPPGLYHAGGVLQKLYNFDFAEKFFEQALSLNEFEFLYHKAMARVRQDDAPVFAVAGKFPNSFGMMKDVGHYFAAKDDATREEGITYFRRAAEIVPGQRNLATQIAELHHDLGEYEASNAVIADWVARYGASDLLTIHMKRLMASNYLKLNEPQKALEICTAQDMDLNAGNVMLTTAAAHEALGQLREAEDVLQRSMKRYPGKIKFLKAMAAFYWRHQRDEEASRVIASGRAVVDQFSRWYFKTFREMFYEASEERILQAVDDLRRNGAGWWEVTALADTFQYGRPLVTVAINKRQPIPNHMRNLEKHVDIYRLLQKTKGQASAWAHLQENVPAHNWGIINVVFFRNGLFPETLQVLEDIEATCPEAEIEHCWFQKLLAWLALEKKPEHLQSIFQKHYTGESPHFGFYIAKFLLGKMTEKELAALIKDDNERCEVAYYLGFDARLKGDFSRATNWYHIARATRLKNNVEFHLASSELFWWAHMGTRNRHTLLTEDLEAYHRREAEKQRLGLD